MSSRTPQECVDLATDSAASRADREDAIGALEAANECDELAAIVTNDDIDDDLRGVALRALAGPQCDATLRNVVEEGSLDPSLQQDAESFLAEQDGD